MVSIDEYAGWQAIKAALQFTAFTMARPIEVRLMRRSEVIWPKSIWRIRAERMKMRRPHDVPLSRGRRSLSYANIRDISEHQQLAFQSIQSAIKPLSENGIRRGSCHANHLAPGRERTQSEIALAQSSCS